MVISIVSIINWAWGSILKCIMMSDTRRKGRNHSRGRRLSQRPTSILTILIMLMAGLSGCLSDPDEDTTAYSNLRKHLDIELERSIATDHLWRGDGPLEPFGDENIYLLLYLRLSNTGDVDLNITQLLFFLHHSDGWDLWIPSLLVFYRFSLDQDPRFVEGELGLENVTIPPGGSISGWTFFTVDNATLEENFVVLDVAFIVDENPVLRRTFSLEDVTVDWSYPSMLSVEPKRLYFTNLYDGEAVDYGERFFVANLSLTNNWPVPVSVDLDEVNLTDGRGRVYEVAIERSGSPWGSSRRNSIVINDSLSFVFPFIVPEDAVPTRLNLTEDPPIHYAINPDSIEEASFPSRVEVVVNYVYHKENAYGNRYLIVNVTINNTSEDIVGTSPGRFVLKDDMGELHEHSSQRVVDMENELESVQLMPRNEIVGEVAFYLSPEWEPDMLVYDDGGRYLELNLDNVTLLTLDHYPRLHFRIRSMNITDGSGLTPWLEWFQAELEVENLLPFEVPFRDSNLSMVDTDGRRYKIYISPPVERHELAFHRRVGPGGSISGEVGFHVDWNSTPDHFEYNDFGYIHKISIDTRDIQVLYVPPKLVISVNQAIYTDRIDQYLAEEGFHYLVLNLTFENIWMDDLLLNYMYLWLWDSNRSLLHTCEAKYAFKDYVFIHELPVGGSIDVIAVFHLSKEHAPEYLHFLRYQNNRDLLLLDLIIKKVDLYPRMNVTIHSMAYQDQVDGLQPKPDHRYLVIDLTLRSNWLEPLDGGPYLFNLLNATERRVYFATETEDLPSCLVGGDINWGETRRGKLYFQVPLDYEPLVLELRDGRGYIQITIDPGQIEDGSLV